MTHTLILFPIGQVVTACEGSSISFWNLSCGRRAQQLTEAHGSDEISCVTLDSSGSRLMTGARNGSIHVWWSKFSLSLLPKTYHTIGRIWWYHYSTRLNAPRFLLHVHETPNWHKHSHWFRLVNPSLPIVINFKFLLQPHHKYYIAQYEELDPFHSLLRWKMIILPILTTSLIHFSLKGDGRMYIFSSGVEGLKWERSAMWLNRMTGIPHSVQRLAATPG